ncbi:MAG TPA: apolipoprotein N-acyltransferase [Gammaproteobacteria bacterium]|nr:apolipoprotein N-acyltransferase [Gammaproteobacteria bacterium]
MASNRTRWVLSAIAGAILPLAFAPFEQFWIAPLSYAVLFYAWRDATPGKAFWIGWLYGAASFGAGTYWTYIAIHDFGEAPIALAAAISSTLVLTLAIFVGAVGWTAARWFKTSGAAAWLGTLPALWVLSEWLRSWVLSGFGWLAAGYSQTDSWLMAYAPLVGIHGMSWVVLLSAGALITLWLGTRIGRGVAAAALLAVWGIGLAAANHHWTEPKDRLLAVALVQGAIQQDLKWRPEQLPGTLALYSELTQQSAGSALIIWPEAAIPELYERVTGYVKSLQEWSERNGSVVMLGILRRNTEGDTDTFQNILIALTDPMQIYVKRHLVPFGEYFPVPDFIRSWMRLMSLPYTDAVPGDDDQAPFDLLGERIALTICYEDVFGAEQLHYFPQATLLVNVSNDAWFGDSIAPHQHLQIARVRAAETGRYLLRSTNTGISAFIDPLGSVVATAPQFEPAILEHSVRGYTGSTPYVRVGNYPVIVAASIVLLLQLLPITKLTIRPRT